MSNTSERLARLQKQQQQLKARIQQEKSRLSASARKERTGKLIAWGVAVEQLILEGSFKEDWWKRHCQLVLSGKTLERALVAQPANWSTSQPQSQAFDNFNDNNSSASNPETL